MELFNQMAAIILVLGLTAAAAWWLRRRGRLPVGLPRKTAGKRLETLERLPLGPQQTLHLIRLGGQALLVAATPAGCALLDRVDLRVLEDIQGAAG
jgi:flagellar biosynthetic protein FliO